MDTKNLIHHLSAMFPTGLATDMVNEFVDMKRDVMTGTYGRSSPGKFVETVVQVLQHMAAGQFDESPNVDQFLRDAPNALVGVDDGLRICASRIARAMYSLRSKRNIVHKGAVDPNIYDLRFLYASAQWILAELVRVAAGVSMREAGHLIDEIEAPVSPAVEDIDGSLLVLANVTIKEEALLLLLRRYPLKMATVEIESSMERRNTGSLRNALRDLWKDKQVDGGSSGYGLTQKGLNAANKVLGRVLDLE